MAVSLHLQLHHRLDVVRRLCALSVAPGQSEAEADAEMVQLVVSAAGLRWRDAANACGSMSTRAPLSLGLACCRRPWN